MSRRTRLPALLTAVAAFVAASTGRDARGDAAADVASDLRVHLDDLQRLVVQAATDLAEGDREAAGVVLGSAAEVVDLALASAPGTGLRRDLRRAARRIAAATAEIESATGFDATSEVRSVRRAAADVGAARRRLRLRGTAACAIVEVGPGRSSIHRAGFGARVRVYLRDHEAALAVGTTDAVAGVRALETDVRRLGRGRYRVTWGPDLGAGAIVADCQGGSAVLRVFNTGPSGALATAPPSGLDFGAATLFSRVGTDTVPVTPTVAGGAPFSFSSDAPLPDGLALDSSTGAVSGTPTTAGPAATVRVTARNARSRTSVDVAFDVDPALPDGVTSLAGGFEIAAVATDEAVPVKMAWAPDGRLFFNELVTGGIRILDAGGSLVSAPYATVPVLTGAERGLLGLAISPDFATDGHVYVYASTAAGDGKPDRNRVLRYTGTGATGSGPEVIVDDLPIHATQNAGHLAFGPDGNLYVTVGDTGDPDRAQADGSLAGRVLRYAPDGTIPADTPIAGSPEWARGFRTPFALAFQPGTGGLFATENGPAAHDELDYVQPGKNFEWGAPPDASFGALRGIRIVDWTPVIVPTGIVFGSGAQFGAAYEGNLFLGSYDLAEVRRFVIDGVDVVSEEKFVNFTDEGIDQKPLDLLVAPDGTLYVSTFTTIWRIRRN